jgi:tetratricopeptide (TPR) repeat protein
MLADDAESSSAHQPVTSPYRYWSFISYSHQDFEVAKRLHTDLERYQIPKTLVGTPGRDGSVPRKLFPIFRDREELPASGDLSGVVRTALAQSACLIVLCSPAAAQSDWVNEEILAFWRLGRAERILAVIVDGEPHAKDPTRECFPPALRSTGPGGLKSAGQALEPLAADMRSSGDGREGAKLKLVAGLLGLSLDDLKHRELLAARKRARVAQGIAATMFLLFVAAVAGGWIAYQNQQKAERRFDDAINIASGVVDQAVKVGDLYHVPGSAIGGLLNWADQSFRALSQEEKGSTFLQCAQANMLIVYSDHYGRTNDTDDQLRSAKQAVTILKSIVQSDPENDRCRRRLAMAYDRLGHAKFTEGRLDEALEAYREALANDERLLRSRPSDPARQRDISVDNERIGTMLAFQGNLQAALTAQTAARSIAEQLARERPTEREAQRDLAVSHEKVGELVDRLGEGTKALEEHRAAFKIRAALARQYPDDAALKRELLVSHNKIGQIALEQGYVDTAIVAHRQALEIALTLAQSDWTNAEWQADLAATRQYLGDALVAQRKPQDAMREYEASLDVLRKLAAHDQRQALYRFSLAQVYERIGDVQLKAGRVEASLASYRTRQDLSRDLVFSEPNNSEWRRDLLIAHVKIAEALQAKPGSSREIEANYQEALKIAEALKAAGRLDPKDDWMISDLQKRLAK